ncbi:hypothetical protein BSKO_09887 [Bryopsis sp. KO-2023]|nr:hypothetical protein BSKO_09887 [Bryopsis sp. KO-2023]
MTEADVGYAYAAAFASWAASLVLFFSSRLLSPLLFKQYASLDYRGRRDWDGRYHSTVHAVVITILGAACVIEFSQQEVNVMHWTTRASNVGLGISLGYFIADVFLILKYKIGDRVMIIHHVACSVCLVAGILVEGCHFYALFALLAECTTPSINLRWLLDAAKMRGAKIYFYNGLALLASWFFVRVVFFPYLFIHIYQNRVILAKAHPWVMPLALGAGVIIYLLNLMWFQKILRGALKLLYPPKKMKKTNQVKEE